MEMEGPKLEHRAYKKRSRQQLRLLVESPKLQVPG